MFADVQLVREPWLVAKLDSMLGDVFGRRRLVRLDRTGRGRSWPPAPRSTRLNGARRPASSTDAVPDVGTPVPVARDRRLAVPVPPRADGRAVLPRGPRVHPGLRVARRRRCRPGDRDADPPVQPALLRARHRVPAARDEEPRVVQPAVRHDLGRQRAGVLRDPRERAAGDPRQRPPAAAAARLRSTSVCSRPSPSPISCRRMPC